MIADILGVQFFEAMMLICFGASWPIAIRKTYTAKRVDGKSRGFLMIIFVGYICGIVAKFIKSATTGEAVDWVTALYALNAVLVATDLMLVLKYHAVNVAKQVIVPVTQPE